MPKLLSIPIDAVEAGMKLASSVSSASGQAILKAGMILEETHIDYLKRRGIKNIQISDTDFGTIDIEKYKRTIEKIGAARIETGPVLDEVDVTTIDPAGPSVVMDRMPMETPPTDAPTRKEVISEEIEKSKKEWKGRREERKKQLEKKHGEAYEKLSNALGDPKPLAPESSVHAARLFNDAVKDVTENMYLEKKLSGDSIDLLTKNITLEIVSRQGMATLLSRAQAAGQYLLAHMVNTSVYSMYLAIQMELSSQEILDVSISGLLSDIGMLNLPEPFWIQNRELNQKETKQLWTHPEESRKTILQTAGARDEWARIAYEHHERLDGSGYPRGIKGRDINICSRIIQICDVYTAATANRAFRDAHLPDDAMRQIMGKPELYDRSIVEIFCQLVGFFPEGFVVLLSSGEHAVVISTNPKNIFRPTVRLRRDKRGRPLMPHEQLVVDLVAKPNIRIVKILEDDSLRWV